MLLHERQEGGERVRQGLSGCLHRLCRERGRDAAAGGLLLRHRFEARCPVRWYATLWLHHMSITPNSDICDDGHVLDVLQGLEHAEGNSIFQAAESWKQSVSLLPPAMLMRGFQ